MTKEGGNILKGDKYNSYQPIKVESQKRQEHRSFLHRSFRMSEVILNIIQSNQWARCGFRAEFHSRTLVSMSVSRINAKCYGINQLG